MSRLKLKPLYVRVSEAADALRYLVEGRPFGRVVLTNLTAFDESRKYMNKQRLEVYEFREPES